MGDWLLALPLLWMTLVIFAAAYLVAAAVCLVVVGLHDRDRLFKAFSPEMLSPLGVIFALLVGFVAFQAWNDFDKAKIAVETEAGALRGVAVLDESLPEEQRIHLRTLINRHIDEAVNREWPAMAQHGLTLASPPTALIEALQLTVSLKPQDEFTTHGPAGDNGCVEQSFGCAASAHHHQSIRGRGGAVGCNHVTGTLHAHCNCYGP